MVIFVSPLMINSVKLEMTQPDVKSLQQRIFAKLELKTSIEDSKEFTVKQ